MAKSEKSIMAGKVVRLENLGKFEITSGQICISDPCYDHDVWCRVGGEPAKKGTWEAFVHKKKLKDWGTRVHRLLAVHEDYSVSDEIEMEELGEAGVDSGQCGVFDTSVYRRDDLVTQAVKDGLTGEPWYDTCCAVTLSDKQAGVIPGGCVSSSGFGDGGYPVNCYRVDDEIVAVEVIFIS